MSPEIHFSNRKISRRKQVLKGAGAVILSSVVLTADAPKDIRAETPSTAYSDHRYFIPEVSREDVVSPDARSLFTAVKEALAQENKSIDEGIIRTQQKAKAEAEKEAEAKKSAIVIPAQAGPDAQSAPTQQSEGDSGCGPFRNGQAVERWYSLVSQYPWDVCMALSIIDGESGGDPNVMNYEGSGACGLWQHLPCQGLGDPAASTALAYEKYLARGWQPWGK